MRAADIPKPDPRDKVQILLGTDYAHLNGTMHGIIGRDFEPIAEFTKLGWAFSGRVKNCQILNGNSSQFGIATARSLGFFTYVNRVNVSPLKLLCQKVPKTGALINPETVLPDVRGVFGEDQDTGDSSRDLDVFPHAKATPSVVTQAATTTVESGLTVYLSVEPNVHEILHELDELVKKNWETEAIGLVEKVPRFSGDIKERSQKQWTRAERLSDEKLVVEYLPDLKQF